MFLFFVAITLFLASGVFPQLCILEYSLSTFSLPSIISGVIAGVVASFRIYQIDKKYSRTKRTDFNTEETSVVDTISLSVYI